MGFFSQLLNATEMDATNTTMIVTPTSIQFLRDGEPIDNGCPMPYDDLDKTGDAHKAMLLTGIVCFIIVFITMTALIATHVTRYVKPHEQRQIIKIALTPVVIALISLISLVGAKEAMYIQPVAYLFAAFAFPALFLFFIQLSVADGEFGPDMFGKLLKRAKRLPGDTYGLWTSNVWIAVFQLPVIFTLCFINQEVTTATKTYCAGSLSPKFGNFWISVPRFISLTVAIMHVVRFYQRLQHLMIFNRPLAQLITLILIVGSPMLVNFIMTFLMTVNAIKPSEMLSYSDIRFGIPALATSIFSVVISVLFLLFFNNSNYKTSPEERTPPLKALLDGISFADIIGGITRAYLLIAGKVDHVPTEERLPTTETRQDSNGRPRFYPPPSPPESFPPNDVNANPYEQHGTKEHNAVVETDLADLHRGHPERARYFGPPTPTPYDVEAQAQRRTQIQAHVQARVRDQGQGQGRDQLRDQAWDEARNQGQGQARNQIRDQIREQTPVRSPVRPLGLFRAPTQIRMQTAEEPARRPRVQLQSPPRFPRPFKLRRKEVPGMENKF